MAVPLLDLKCLYYDNLFLPEILYISAIFSAYLCETRISVFIHVKLKTRGNLDVIENV